MCPVRWSLKNQRTAQAVPIADILRCVGISVCMIVASWAEQRMLFSRAECPAAMTALDGGAGKAKLQKRSEDMSNAATI